MCSNLCPAAVERDSLIESRIEESLEVMNLNKQSQLLSTAWLSSLTIIEPILNFSP